MKYFFANKHRFSTKTRIMQKPRRYYDLRDFHIVIYGQQSRVEPLPAAYKNEDLFAFIFCLQSHLSLKISLELVDQYRQNDYDTFDNFLPEL